MYEMFFGLTFIKDNITFLEKAVLYAIGKEFQKGSEQYLFFKINIFLYSFS